MGEKNTAAYRRFADFYPHFVGTTLGLIAALHAFSTLNFWWAAAGLIAGYAFAWATASWATG